MANAGKASNIKNHMVFVCAQTKIIQNFDLQPNFKKMYDITLYLTVVGIMKEGGL